MSQNPVRYRDLDLSLGLIPRTRDVQAVTDVESIKRHIKRLLMLNQHDVPFHPEISTGLLALEFETFGTQVAALGHALVKNAIQQWEPRVDFIDAVVTYKPERREFNVDLTVRIKRTQEVIEYTTILKRLR